ncbi:EF-hand domain-containing protein [Terricaulis silvestris]|uniref:EF hand n=1 Tax=Terricaulis silvestris TaxID=2686094 RepID=A0A6I6MFQ8_9CAUL|nr:hypothetical protein [Terricaulis silvestris]QGZ93345.1 EF hand [Terricaulis silvestris]
MSVRILMATLATAIVGAGACSPQPEAQPQQQAENERQGGRGGFLRRADANEDGIVTRAEFDASAGDRFVRRDDNSDGAITEDERQGRGGGPDSGDRSGRGGGRMMDADANEDGIITRAEFDASQSEMFARFDEDQSGAIESSELPARRTD